MSRVSIIAKSIVDLLNAKNDWSIPFTAVKRYVARADVSDLKNLTVTVVPSGIEYAPETRSLKRVVATVEIGIQKHLSTNDKEGEISDLGSVCDEIVDYLFWSRFTVDNVQFANLAIENNPVFDVKHLLQKNTFTGVIRLQFQAFV